VNFADAKQCSGDDNGAQRAQSSLGVAVAAAMKRMTIGADANDPLSLVPFHHDRPAAGLAWVLPCILNKSNLYVLSLLAGLLAIPISLPAAPLDSRLAVSTFYITSWTAKDGLPSSILGLAQTTDGFLWIAGTEGLFRFDGIAMERYTPQNGAFLHDSVLRSLLASSDGGLWIGYGLGGASFLKNGKITNHTQHDGLPAGLTRCFVQDRDGTVWAAFAGGLARFNSKHWQNIQMDWNYPGKTSWGVVVDQAGTVWTASEDRIVSLPRGGRMFQDSGLSVTSGRLIVAPDNALRLTEPRKNSIVPLQLQSGLLKRGSTKIEAEDWSPIFDHGGGLWIGSWGNGVLHIPSPNDLRDGTFSRLSPGAETFTEAEGLSDNHAMQFLEDREGNIWVGTNEGLSRLRHSSLSWIALQPGLHDFSLIPGPMEKFSRRQHSVKW
jgi:ligand-binding sensor domain-containing protein